MAFATASSPANRKPGATRKPQHHPKRKRDRVNRQGTPNPLRAPEPQHAPEPASAHQAPSACQAPSTPEPASACQNPQRTPEPQRAPGRKPGGFAADHVLASRAPSAPGRKPGSRALTEPSIGLRDVNRAEQRVPRALAGPSREFPRRKIVNLVQPWSKLTILRSLKAKTRDYLRYRKAHTRTTGKNVRFSLPRPRKTVCFDRQRPKQPVFRIAHPTRQPIPMPNKQHSRHRSR